MEKAHLFMRRGLRVLNETTKSGARKKCTICWSSAGNSVISVICNFCAKRSNVIGLAPPMVTHF